MSRPTRVVPQPGRAGPGSRLRTHSGSICVRLGVALPHGQPSSPFDELFGVGRPRLHSVRA